MAFLLYLLQINIALSLLYLCYKVLFSQNTFFGLRRLILISIVLFSTTYPWYDIPDIDPIISAHLQITLPEVLYSMGETVPQKAFDIYPLIAYLYGGICSLFLLRMFLRIASIIKLRANGKLRIIGESHIIVCDENIQPCSFFRWIFLPHSILQNKNTLTRILRHENTHIRQLHTIDVLLGESMAALCWINPLSWLLLKEIRLNLEYMADEAAIPDEQEKKTYQYLLLDISQSNNELPSAIPFNYSFLKTRIRMINRKRSQTTSVFKYLLILPLFLAIVTANQCCTDQQPLQSEIEKVFPKPSEVQTKDSSTTASETSETPLEVAEIMPEFPGGTEALLSFIKDNLEYPQKAIDEQTEGRVIIRFVVNSNGEISDPTILKGINKNLDQAAIDVINKLPRWKPGQQDVHPSHRFQINLIYSLKKFRHMKKTLLSSMIIILMGLLGACSSNTSDKTSLSEQSVSENKTATPVAIEVPDTLGKTYDAVEVMPEFPGKTYDAVEVMPEFPGGTEALLSFIKGNLKYPQKAIDEQTEGRVIVQFVIDKTGKVSSPEVIRGVTSELDQAALDIVSALPDWKPGEQDGQKVNVKYTLPVVFKLI